MISGTGAIGRRVNNHREVRLRRLFHREIVGSLIAFICLATAACSSSEQAASDSKPNVLLIFADDQRADTIAALGNPIIKTPNIDRLVNTGFRFERAYCMGSTQGAVCVPSRAMLNSGRSLFRVTADLEGIPTLGETLRQAGYTTFATGKWHNRPASFMRSFERGKNVFFGGMSDHTKVPIVDVENGEMTEKRFGEAFSSTLFADAAVEFLESYDSEKPFYAYLAFTAPHDPRQAPEGYIDMYDPEAVPLPASFAPQHPFFTGWMTGRDEKLAAWPRTEAVVRSQIAEYYGLITHMDHEIGRVLEALEKTGQAENTIVIYAADHGLAIGSHGLLGKQNLYEHSTRAPMIFVGRGIPQGKSSDALVYLFDIFPTISELIEIDSPEGVEGESLAPIWRGAKTGVRDSLYTAYAEVMRAVRDDRWKLIRYPHINKSQLFDLSNDPDEMNDLSAGPEQAERLDAMMELLADWQQKVGDKTPLTSAEPQDEAIDLSGRERTPDQHQPDWIVEKYFSVRTR